MPLFGLSLFSWLLMLAGAAMAIRSVTVVANSILLGRYKTRFGNIKKL